MMNVQNVDAVSKHLIEDFIGIADERNAADPRPLIDLLRAFRPSADPRHDRPQPCFELPINGRIVF